MRKLFSLFTAVLTCASLFSQSTVTIDIDASVLPKPISPYIFGKNNNLSDNSSKPLTAAQWQVLRDLGIRMFRENGGNNSTKYNWRRKISSHPDWYNNVYAHNWDFATKSLQEKIPNAQIMWAFQLSFSRGQQMCRTMSIRKQRQIPAISAYGQTRPPISCIVLLPNFQQTRV